MTSNVPWGRNVTVLHDDAKRYGMALGHLLTTQSFVWGKTCFSTLGSWARALGFQLQRLDMTL